MVGAIKYLEECTLCVKWARQVAWYGEDVEAAVRVMTVL